MALTWEPHKGLNTRNTHLKHERSMTHHSNVMANDNQANVKVYLRTNKLTDRQMDRQTGQNYMPQSINARA